LTKRTRPAAGRCGAPPPTERAGAPNGPGGGRPAAAIAAEAPAAAHAAAPAAEPAEALAAEASTAALDAEPAAETAAALSAEAPVAEPAAALAAESAPEPAAPSPGEARLPFDRRTSRKEGGPPVTVGRRRAGVAPALPLGATVRAGGGRFQRGQGGGGDRRPGGRAEDGGRRARSEVRRGVEGRRDVGRGVGVHRQLSIVLPIIILLILM